MTLRPECISATQIGFQDFLQKCEILEFDFDPKAIQQGRLHARDMHKFKVGPAKGSCRPAEPCQGIADSALELSLWGGTMP